MKDLATTYSRGSYTATTIGKAAFDGRVRDGIGSGHCFMVTKKFERAALSENYTQPGADAIRGMKSLSLPVERRSDQAARPISISPLNALPRLHA